MREGEWIRNATPEPEPPKAGRWIARPRRTRWIPQTFGGIFLLSQLPDWLNLLFGRDNHLLVVRIVAMVLIVVLLGVILFGIVRRRLARRIRAEDRALVDGSFGDQFPVEMTIVVGKQPIGTDRGALWFADGLVGFSGEVASFVLAARDVEVAWTSARSRPARGAIPQGSLILVGTRVPSYVIVEPLGEHAKAFRERLRRFEGETADPDAERHWPPLAPYDEAPALPPSEARA